MVITFGYVVYWRKTKIILIKKLEAKVYKNFCNNINIDFLGNTVRIGAIRVKNNLFFHLPSNAKNLGGCQKTRSFL